MKIIICANTGWNLINFRIGLIRAMISKGYDVVVLAPYDKHADEIEKLGCRFTPLHIDNGGSNPIYDIFLFSQFLKIFIRERPDIFLGYTVKPNIYGSIAARLFRINVINNITGLGSVFLKNGWMVHIVRMLYRIALKKSSKVFFQNNDDRQLFICDGLIKPELTDLLPGSGINLIRFKPVGLPSSDSKNSKFRFLLVARMLRDKGVVEFIRAANLIKREWPHAEFCLLGFVDVKNPTAISREEIDGWVSLGVIKYLGVSEDVRNEISSADCVVLPSYREGTPRSLLEAAAMARPIITTDAVGCREVVEDGINGYLCKVGSEEDLAKKMAKMLALSNEQRSVMGLMGRKKIEAQFSEQMVIDSYLAVIKQLETID